MLIIGIVGVPAGGKSTVAAHLAALGATRIDADQIAHQVLQTPAIAAQVINYFGGDIATDEGEIDRRKLGKLVFGDDDSSRQGLIYLESLIHPPTRQIIGQQLALAKQLGATAVVLDIPLLFESGWASQCDEIWFVETSKAIQLAAAKRRGWTIENLQLRQVNQLAVDEKRQRSSRIILNQGTLQELHTRVEKLWRHCLDSTPIDRSLPSVEKN